MAYLLLDAVAPALTGDEFWHGMSGFKARAVADSGIIRPSKLAGPASEWRAPMPGHVYLTKNISYALRYAYGKPPDKEGGIALVRPALSKAVPDEDWLASLVSRALLRQPLDAGERAAFDALSTGPAKPLVGRIAKLGRAKLDEIFRVAPFAKDMIQLLREKDLPLLRRMAGVATDVAIRGSVPVERVWVFSSNVPLLYKNPAKAFKIAKELKVSK